MADCIRSYKHNEIAQACRILKYTHIYPDGEIWKDMCAHSISELLHRYSTLYLHYKTNSYCTVLYSMFDIGFLAVHYNLLL